MTTDDRKQRASEHKRLGVKLKDVNMNVQIPTFAALAVTFFDRFFLQNRQKSWYYDGFFCFFSKNAAHDGIMRFFLPKNELYLISITLFLLFL